MIDNRKWVPGDRLNSNFQEVTKGCVECPKCFGCGELDKTDRNKDGWPLSPPRRITCDFCEGEGEILPGKAAEAPSQEERLKTRLIVAINTPTVVREEIAAPEPKVTGWPEPVRVEVEVEVEPEPSGWAIFNG